MPSIQQNYPINPDASPTKWLKFTINVQSIAPEVVDELWGKPQEFKNRLASETDGTVDESKFQVKKI